MQMRQQILNVMRGNTGDEKGERGDRQTKKQFADTARL